MCKEYQHLPAVKKLAEDPNYKTDHQSFEAVDKMIEAACCTLQQKVENIYFHYDSLTDAEKVEKATEIGTLINNTLQETKLVELEPKAKKHAIRFLNAVNPLPCVIM